MIGVTLALSFMLDDPAEALRAYLARPEPSYRFESLSDDRLRMTSLVWRGHAWRHDVIVRRPAEPTAGGTIVLHVTGGNPNQTDLEWAQSLADLSGCRVATLFQIPAQPIDGRVEDDLIAYSFDRYLATGEPDWPLPLPMAKAAIKAMDALQAHEARAGRRVERFLVTGASKRGWASWLTAASGDDRVAGIAPLVFDNLDFPRQLAKQLADWGGFSPMLKDYTERGLTDVADSPRGRDLVRIVDPAAYEVALRTPVLMVHGSNDPYWTVDALSVYWERLAGPRAVVVVPNMGHGWGSIDFWTPAVAAFARSLEAGAALPYLRWDAATDDDGQILVSARFEGAQPTAVRAWVAESDDLKFHSCLWGERAASAFGQEGRRTWVYGRRPGERNCAVFLSATFRDGAREYRLTTPVRVVRKAEAQSRR